MKKTFFLGTALCLFSIFHAFGSDDLQVIERGRDYKILSRTISTTNANGTATSRVSKYVELATGKHYFENGEWKETDPRIEVDALGGFVEKGPHKVRFAPNVNSVGAIELTLPCGTMLRSHVLGLSYFDTEGNSVLIAEIKDSIGEVVGDNQIYYRDAFTDFEADVRYTYTEAGLEQDIILREQPPFPQEYGLNPETTRLQVLTEFLQPPAPTKVQALVGGMQIDELISFGSMCIGHGKAFFENGPTFDVGVDKVWTQIDGRDLLIEEVEFDIVEDQVETLPLPPQARLRLHAPNVEQVASELRLPAARQAKVSKESIRVAAYRPTKPGFVVDYLILNTTENMVFKADTTYYVDQSVTLTGTTVFEGGAVIKYTNGVNNLRMTQSGGNIISDTGFHRPVIFTSKDDDSVGDPIVGSTGAPTTISNSGQFLRISSLSADLSNFRFSYANTGVEYIQAFNGSNTLSHVQFLNCDTAVRGSAARFYVRNALIANVGTAFKCNSATGVVEHLTLSQADQLMLSQNASTSLAFTNSLFASLTNFGSTSFSTNYVEIISDPAAVFEQSVAGSYYLKSNTILTNSSSEIEPTLLASLGKKTTQIPTIWTNEIAANTVLEPQAERGDVANLHLGYHYDAIDYVFSNVVLSNAVLSLTNGVVLAVHGERGIILESGSEVRSDGSPLSLNKIVHPLSAQEGSGINWNSGIESVFGEVPTATAPIVNLRFTELSLGSAFGNYIVDGSNLEQIHLRDSQVFGGSFLFQTNGTIAGSISLTNNLFRRVRFNVETGTNVNSLLLFNNTFNEGELHLSPEVGNIWQFQDNVFNLVAITQNVASVVSSNNAYVLTNSLRLSPTNSGDVILADAAFTGGTLGRFYYATNSPLIDSGSRTASEAGLSHYTVTTNQVRDTSLVDVGFHYVALDEDGLPIDSDGDGIPDYKEDANGNGVLDAGETDHTDYYNGVLPVIEVMQSGEEWLEPGTTTTNGIVIRVKTQSAVLLTNAPISLQISQGPCSFSPNSIVQLLDLRTDANGEIAPAFLTVPIDVSGQTFNVIITAVTSIGSVTENISKTILDKVLTPKLMPSNSTFAAYEDVRVTCATSGASLHYSLDGTDPTTNHPAMSGEYLRINSSANLRVKGFLAGSLPSSIANGLYTRAAGISAGGNQSFAIRADGDVFAWGENTRGQLGTGTNLHLSTPVLVLSNFTAIASGQEHTLGLSNETVWAWGHGANGQLGDGTTTTKYLPVGITNGMKAISAGNSHSLALDTNRIVWAWGWNDSGRLGDGTTTQRTSPVQVTGLSDVSAMVAGANYSLAISNGSVWAWGNNSQGRLGDGTTTHKHSPVEIGLTNVSAVAAGDGHSLAISNGVVYSWGRGVYGRLGIGDTSNQLLPVRTSLSNIVAIAAGTDHSLALDGEGRVWSWGYNSQGQLGDGTTSNRSTPVCVASNIVGIAAGFRHSLALQDNGQLIAWGKQDFGQLGNGQFDYAYSPAIITNLPPVQAIGLGDYHCLVLLSNQTLMAWGNNNGGQVGMGSSSDNVPYITSVSDLTNVTAISAGANHNLAVSNGSVWAWGDGTYGKLGYGSTSSRSVPAKVNDLEFVTSIAAGGNFSAAVSNETVWAWGQGGRLGDGGTTAQYSPVNASNGGVPISGITNLSAGQIHTLALISGGAVWAWGDNLYGRLGDGSSTDRLEPVQSTNFTGGYLEGFSLVVAGHEHSLAISNGIVWSWGYNDHGQLGDPSGDNSIPRRQTPTAILLSNIVSVAAGYDHSLALDSTGLVYAWGRNQRGQLGAGNLDNSNVPVLVPNLTNVVAIAGGGFNSMALLGEGSVVVWGDVTEGQLADGNVGYKTVPTLALINDLHYNDPPTILCSNSAWVLEDQILTNQIVIADSDAGEENLVFSIIASNGFPQFVLTNGLHFIEGTNGITTNLVVQAGLSDLNLALAEILYFPQPNYWGADTLQILVNDLGNVGIGGNQVVSNQIVLQIEPVNDAPIFTKGNDILVLEDSGQQELVGWATQISVGLQDDPEQELSFALSNDNVALFQVQPAVANDGTLTYETATNANGSATVSIVLTDDGGTDHGGIDSTGITTFTITVTAVNDAPSIVCSNSAWVLEERILTNQIVLIDSDVGEENLTISLKASNGIPQLVLTNDIVFIEGNNGITTNLMFQGTLSNLNLALAEILYVPDTNYWGTDTLHIVVDDLGNIGTGGSQLGTNHIVLQIEDVNDAPSFVSGGDIFAYEDTPVVELAWATDITAGLLESYQSVLFHTTNDNTSLFLVQPTIDSLGRVTFTPATNAYGSAVVSVWMTDDGGTANGGLDSTSVTNFTINVTSLNDAPSITPIDNISVDEDSGEQTVNLSGINAGASDESGQTISISAYSSNTNLILDPTVDYSSPDSTGTLRFTPLPDCNGTVTLFVVLQDDGGATNGGLDTFTNSFTVTIISINDAPSFQKGSDFLLMEDSGPQILTNWATQISPGPAAESEQEMTFHLSSDNNSLFSVQPAITPEGVLSFTPASDANGIANVVVVLQDDGGTLSGGIDIATNGFTVRIAAVDDSPRFEIVDTITTNEDCGTISIEMGVNVGPENESFQSLTSLSVTSDNPELILSPLIIYTHGQTNAQLLFTPAAEMFGTATLTISAADNGTSNNGGTNFATKTLFVTINSVNDAPSFVSGSDQKVNYGSPAQAVSGWATSISPGPSNELSQVLSFVVTNDNESLFLIQPALSSEGTLTYTPDPNTNGFANVTVILTDDGGTSNGGVDSSLAHQLAIIVTNVVATPQFAPANGTIPLPPQTVVITCETPGASIHYTLDGTVPTALDTTITNGGSIAVSNFTVVKARAFRDGWGPSEVQSQVYRFVGKVAAGWSHSLLLQPDMTVWIWGENSSDWAGTLGIGGFEDVPLPVRVVGLSNIVQFDGGLNYSIALDRDGNVFTWGSNYYGELGDGTLQFKYIPEQLTTVSNITRIANGDVHSLALQEDGSLLAWGWNEFGSLGDGSTNDAVYPVEVAGLGGIMAMDGGGYHSIAVTSNGLVWAWGGNDEGQLGDGTFETRLSPVLVSGLTNIVDVKAGFLHSVALASDGTVWAWGNDTSGGIGNFGSTNRPVQVIGLTNVVAIAATDFDTTFLLADGSVWYTEWTGIAVPEEGLSNIVQIACGGNHTLAIDLEGRLWGWGWNDYGAIGVGHFDDVWLREIKNLG